MINPGTVLASTPKNKLFINSLVFVYQLTQTEVHGLAINTPTQTPMFRLFENIQLQPTISFDQPIYKGGLDDIESVFLLHSSEWSSISTFKITPQISISSDREMLVKYAKGNVPRKWKYCAGMIRWSLNKFQIELNEQKWYVLPNNSVSQYVFSYKSNIWKPAIKLCSQDIVNSWI